VAVITSSLLHPVVLSSLQIKNNLFLAPMAGYTNKVFRELVKSFGAGLTFTEMVSVEGILRDNKKTFKYIDPDSNGITGVQLFGPPEPQNFYKAALMIKNTFNIELIDINFGCPVKKVLKGEAGAFLLNYPEKMADIVKALKDTGVIVSAKIRSGFNTINIEKTIPLLEKAGVDMITFHPRLATQFYTGKADWSLFKIARKLTGKTLIANGDIKSPLDVEHFLVNYGVDGVMIGRKALEAPYIFEIIIEYFNNGIIRQFSFEKIKEIIIEFVRSYCEYYRTESIISIRSILMFMTKNFPYSREIRARIGKAVNYKDIEEIFVKEKIFL
jgi:nifR3 family TIM-barrel protein